MQPEGPVGEQLPDGAHLIEGAVVLVLLHHRQLFASPHQNCPHPATRKVGVQLGREYLNSFWRQSLDRRKKTPEKSALRSKSSWHVCALVLFTHSLGTLRGAISAEVEDVLFGWDGHDGRVDEAQFHDAGVIFPQTRRVMKPYPR